MEAGGQTAHQVQPLAVAPLPPEGGLKELGGHEVVDAAFVGATFKHGIDYWDVTAAAFAAVSTAVPTVPAVSFRSVMTLRSYGIEARNARSSRVAPEQGSAPGQPAKRQKVS